MTHRCRIASQWHVEVDGDCDINVIRHYKKRTQKEEEHGELLVCGYSQKKHGTAGVILVDPRQGEIVQNVSCSLHVDGVEFSGMGEKVVWIDVSGDGRVECVTSMGRVWRFWICLDGQGVFERVEHVEWSDSLLRVMEMEDSPMEAVVLESMSPGAVDARLEEQTVNSTTQHGGPEFIKEGGYRGPKQGYTYWKEKGGYCRNDCMRRHVQESMMKQPESGKEGEQRPVLGRKGLIRCFQRLPKTSQYVMASCGSEDGMVYVGTCQDVSKRGESMVVEATCDKGLIGHLSGVLVFAVSPDERFVASGSYDQTIRVWDTETWSCVKILKGHGGGIKCLAFTRDGSMLLSAASDNTIRVWSTSAWLCMRHLHGRHEDATWPVSMAMYDGEDAPRFLLSGSNGLFGGSTLKVFDISSGDCLATFAQLRYDQKGSCTAVSIMDSTRLVTAATDHTLACWDCSWYVEEKKPLLKGGFFFK